MSSFSPDCNSRLPRCFIFSLSPLKIMLIVVTLFLPIVLGYQVWAYTLLKGKVTPDDLNYEEAY